jgi:hypothetical protein
MVYVWVKIQYNKMKSNEGGLNFLCQSYLHYGYHSY